MDHLHSSALSYSAADDSGGGGWSNCPGTAIPPALLSLTRDENWTGKNVREDAGTRCHYEKGVYIRCIYTNLHASSSVFELFY